ncbi:MAG TPA: hypothetical protein VES69_05225, partial [Pyrinomonadaceae bacterium]|nr:hypothetical protein [Pyrinomonadaceae bacterium]
MDKQRSFSKDSLNDFISADFRVFGNVVKNTREGAEFEGSVPWDCHVMFAQLKVFCSFEVYNRMIRAALSRRRSPL